MIFTVLVIVLSLLAAAVAIDSARKLALPKLPEGVVVRRRVSDPWIAASYPPAYHNLKLRDEPPLWSSAWWEFRRGDSLPAETLDALVIEAAFHLEFRTRRLFAGAQFKGVLSGSKSVVWYGEAAREIRRLLAAHRPGPEARACIDRALGWWAAARAQGMRIFEWDRPGYDEVTAAFHGLEDLAETAVKVDPAAHGVLVETWETRYEQLRDGETEALPRLIGSLLVLAVLLLWLAGILRWSP